MESIDQVSYDRRDILFPMTLKELSSDIERELIAYSPLVRRLLVNRGILTKDAAETFLHPDYERDVSDPFLMKNLETLVDRVQAAVGAGERICVYADYDCDGIPGAVMWDDLFKKIGYSNYRIYIPDRHKEGYGLNQAALDDIASDGVKILITLDLGITAVDDVEYAKGLGLEVFVTDHHIPQETLPDTIIINPKQPGDSYPDDMLCGAGVAFKVIQGFIKKYGSSYSIIPGWEKWLLDMAGLATLADMVPLVKENRALAHYGLQVLRKTRRPGLLALFSHARIHARTLQEDDITFSICPKLNAAGRMDSPRRAFELLSATLGEASSCAEGLVRMNDERKTLVATIMKSIKRTFGKRSAPADGQERSVIVIGDPSWRVGVLGLVAGKITEEYKKPAFVWGLEGGTVIKGSCRSDGTVNLVELMACLPEESLLEFGGHEGAGGFSVSHESIHFLEERLEAAYQQVKRIETVSAPHAIAEADLSLDEVNAITSRDIEQLAPFGVGNPKPVFRFVDVTIGSVKAFGKTKEHLELLFQDSRGRTVKAIEFFASAEKYGVVEGQRITLFAHLERSVFGYKEEIRLRIIDIS